MKKSLSLLVAITMVFSMFASTAFAADKAEPTQQDKFDALKELGIFSGFPDGSAGLDQNMTRAQFAKVLMLINGLEENPAASTYSDVSATHWAKGFIGAVTEAELMNGVGNNKFDPNGNVTIEALAKTLVLSLGLEEVEGAEVAGTSAWAAGYVQAALDADLLPELPAYNVAATRGLLVDASYAYLGGEAVTVKSAEAVDATTVKVTFSDDEVVTKTLDTALEAGKATKVTVEYNGKSYEVEVTLQALAAEAKVTGAKTVTVSLNQAVDTAKATFAVKNSTASAVNVDSVKFSDDKKTATLTFSTNLLAGDFTVSVGGVQTDAVTAKFTVEAEKVAKIEFTSDKAPISRTDATQATVGYKILNQYGEDVTSTKYGQITFTSGYGAPASVANGSITIDKGAADFVIDEKVNVTALDAASTTFASAVVTVVAKAQVSQVTFDKLYNADNNTLTVGETNPQAYYVTLSAKDQYGNSIAANAAGAAILNSDVIVTTSNQTVIDVVRALADNKGDAVFTTVNIDGTDYLALQLYGYNAGTVQYAGTARLTAVSKVAGNPVGFDVTVKEAVKVDTITLSAPSIAVIGEDLTIPFSAVDQFGNAVDKASTLNAGIVSASFNSASKGSGINFVQNYVTGKSSLVITNAGGVSVAGNYVLTVVTGTGKVQYLSINVVNAVVPTVVSGIKDFTKTLAVGATAEFDIDNVVISDQYGRAIDHANLGGYTVEIVSGTPAKVSYAGNTVTAVAKGTSTFTLTLKNASNQPVAGSAYTFVAKVVEAADIASYELADIPTLYAGAAATTAATNAAYGQTVTVNGVLADGSKVTLPTSSYQVVVVGSNVDYVTASNKVVAYGGTDASFTDGAKTVTVVATIAGSEQVVKSASVKVTTAAPAPAALSIADSNGVVTNEGNSLVSVTAANVNDTTKLATVVNQAVKAVDQYGFELTEGAGFYTVIPSNFTNSHTLTTVAAGDAFSVTAVTTNGQIISFKVAVK